MKIGTDYFFLLIYIVTGLRDEFYGRTLLHSGDCGEPFQWLVPQR